MRGNKKKSTKIVGIIIKVPLNTSFNDIIKYKYLKVELALYARFTY